MDANKENSFSFDHTSDYKLEASYDHPQYRWGSPFQVHHYKMEIDSANSEYWSAVKAAICEKVGIFPRDGGFRGYATRMLRRRVRRRSLPLFSQWT